MTLLLQHPIYTNYVIYEVSNHVQEVPNVLFAKLWPRVINRPQIE